MNAPQYIFQVTRAALERIFRAASPIRGRGIAIEDKGDGVEYSIDEREFKRMLWAFSHNGGFSSTFANLDSVSLDPDA